MSVKFKYVILLILWILFSLRIYPTSLEKTLLESAKIIIGSGLYAVGMTLIVNGLKYRFTKSYFSREQFIKWVLVIALITSISASFEHYLKIKG